MPRPAALPALLLSLAAPAQALCPLGEGATVRRIVSCRDSASLKECRRAAEEQGCSVVRELESIKAVVIEVDAGSAEDSDKLLLSAAPVERVDNDPKINWLKSPAPRSVFEAPFPTAEQALASIGGGLKPPPPREAADPEQPWGIVKINAAAAWSKSRGEKVRVAVIDTGIDARHPDLKERLAGGWSAVDAKNRANFQDDQGHGTHVAGTIAAARDGQGVVGAAPQAELYAVKVLDGDGNGNYDDIIAGIEWCAKNRIQVANLSLGAEEGSEPLRRAVAAAAKRGVLLVAAAGNGMGGPVSFPAAYPEAIAVSASDRKDRFAAFSSRGPEVDFIAPGAGIASDRLGGGTVEHDGTSMAAPHVAGLAALAVALGARGPGAARAALEAAAGKLPGLSPDQQGAGLIDAGRLSPRSEGGEAAR